MPAASSHAPSVQTLDLRDIGLLVRRVRLTCGCCSSGQRFAMGFLPTDPSRRSNCPSARPSHCRAANRLTCRLFGLHAAGSLHASRRILRDPSKVEPAFLRERQSSRGPNYRTALRSIDQAARLPFAPRLSRPAPPDSIRRCGSRALARIPDQPVRPTRNG
jgi:hypothetical protein